MGPFVRVAAYYTAIVFSLATFHTAQAQAPDLLNGLSRLVDTGMRAAVQAQWEEVPNAEIACIDRQLHQTGRSINAIIAQGIGPSDRRVADYRNACRATADIQPNASGPSFDCNLASQDDEIAICGDSELSRLDRAIAAGFTYLRGRYGQNGAQSVAGPLLRQRQACDGNVACIKRVQLMTISAFQSRGAPIQADQAAPRSGPSYVVDGVVLGSRPTPDSPTFRDFNCAPSEQFSGFTWCRRNRTENSPRGQFASSNSILLAPDGTADYLNRYLEPAFFAGNEANDDINRLSIRLGPPNIIPMPANAAASNGLLAYWGAVSLIPLEPNLRAELAAGRDIKAGLLLDHLGKLQQSAQLGLPVYRLSGGAGYVWVASWGNDGRGVLRFLAVDASKLPAVVPPVATIAAPVETPTQAAASTLTSTRAGAPSNASDRPTSDARVTAPAIATQHEMTPAEAEARDVEPPEAPATPPVTATQAAPAPMALAAKPATPAAQGSPPLAKPEPAPSVASAPPTVAAPAQASPTSEPTGHIRDVGTPSITAAPALRPESNTVTYLLIAIIAALCAIVGLLLVRMRRPTPPAIGYAPTPDTATSPAQAATDAHASTVDMIVPPVTMTSGVPPLPAKNGADDALNLASLTPADKPIDAMPPTATEPGAFSRRIADAAASGASAASDATSIALKGFDRTGTFLNGLSGWTIAGGGLALLTLLLLPTGIGALVPLAIAGYLLPTIIAFRRRHVYAWAVFGINLIFGFTGLVWLAMLVWSASGITRSPLDTMDAGTGAGLTGQPGNAVISDRDLQSGWKMPLLQAELFGFEAAEGPVLLKPDQGRVFLKNGVIGLFVPNGYGGTRTLRYDVKTQLRCVAPISADTKVRAGKTIARSALTGLGAAIFTGRHAALGGAMLDYRFAGDETEEVVTALAVLSDYSSLVFQCGAEEYLKVTALLPPDLVDDDHVEEVGEQLARIRRMADDGPRVLIEADAFIEKADRRVTELTAQADTGKTFAERDAARLELRQAQSDLDDARAVRNAVEALIVAGQPPDRLRSA